MKRTIFVVLILAVGFWGCATTVRYSPEEIKEYPPEVQEQIRQGNVALGMTAQQVRYAWGSPTTVNVLSPTQEGKLREEWIYSSGIMMQRRLLFVDGKLFDIFPQPKPSVAPAPEAQQPQQEEKK